MPAICGRTVLDLGSLRDIAVVRVNGRVIETLWTPPWTVDISDALKAGSNQLEVDVINVWNNRLLGDAKLPAEKRQPYIAHGVRCDKLLPAGLLGPITLKSLEVSK